MTCSSWCRSRLPSSDTILRRLGSPARTGVSPGSSRTMWYRWRKRRVPRPPIDTCHPPFGSHGGEDGQIVIGALFGFIPLLVLLISLLNTQLVTEDKVRRQTAADATA